MGGEGRLGQGCFALRGAHGRKAPGVAHVQGHRGHEGLVILEVELIEKHPLDCTGQRSLGLEPDRGQPGALLENAFHVFAVVVVNLVGGFRGVKVRVAGDADDVGVFDLVHAKYHGGVMLQGMLQEYEFQALARKFDDPLALAGQGNQSKGDAFGPKVLGRLAVFTVLAGFPFAVLVLAGFAVFAVPASVLYGMGLVKPDHHIQPAVFQMGEGVAGIDNLRRKEGRHIGPDVSVQVLKLFLVQVLHPQVLHAFGGKLLPDILVDELVVGIELMAALVNGVELLRGGHAGFQVNDGLLDQGQVREAAHTDHEKLLQVAPEDGDKKQRHVGIRPLVKHPLVELQPGQLPVLHVRRYGDGRCGHHGNARFLHPRRIPSRPDARSWLWARRQHRAPKALHVHHTLN